jgi:hypothetical protein
MISKRKVAAAAMPITVLVLLLSVSGFEGPASGGEADARHTGIEQSSSYTIGSTVTGSAGSPGTSTNYSANGTMGQSTPIGAGTAGGKTLNAGFWDGARITTEVDDIPVAFRLRQNYPNPFNPVTTIEFSLARGCAVNLTIYDVSGRAIRRLVHEPRPAGRYREIWDGTNERGARVATGLYFYRLEAGSFTSVKKMVFLR